MQGRSNTKERNEYNSSHRKRNSEDDAFYQGVYIGVLNKFYDLRIEKPELAKTIAHPFFRIVSISTEYDEIQLAEYVENRCNEIFQSDISSGMKVSTVQRRFERNKVIETLHLMVDAIEMKDFSFSSTENNAHVDKHTYYIKDKYNTLDIIKKGCKINEFITQLFTYESELLLQKNDQSLQQILGF
ncbi:hypothetical protein EIN_376160 [Entamoeba invadens IP1]|uniref:Uncharacterized protein n=1 Tax=Entamoeba invadens IP1 TaxID=370355 RepID=A0A0A1TY94_ENTIV|nr:hypothetical protein EIN_376160 [Entamoeba invadens IP1]ELP83471.1 hypothetical protein EIN_376160 [Entamoeba invadens IP1]|eukprot:XP_004182817.1 hypothetical protein EIN_376160 [Entamoeba invadens IP1]